MNHKGLTPGGMHLPGKKATLRKYLEVCIKCGTVVTDFDWEAKTRCKF